VSLLPAFLLVRPSRSGRRYLVVDSAADPIGSLEPEDVTRVLF
jgi:hypothetical protein